MGCYLGSCSLCDWDHSPTVTSSGNLLCVWHDRMPDKRRLCVPAARQARLELIHEYSSGTVKQYARCVRHLVQALTPTSRAALLLSQVTRRSCSSPGENQVDRQRLVGWQQDSSGFVSDMLHQSCVMEAAWATAWTGSTPTAGSWTCLATVRRGWQLGQVAAAAPAGLTAAPPGTQCLHARYSHTSWTSVIEVLQRAMQGVHAWCERPKPSSGAAPTLHALQGMPQV